ncbi:Uncharacterised protein [Salmonella enterica subsp. diarizonae]|uniref:Uncharacterized protein n=1 Tax=Salmonella diarizonae TaxID=59204 RepID=A0A379TRR8_SALDZ|nr:Uncharacterised protein [Salmonella enterica subsp. diarizonae]
MSAAVINLALDTEALVSEFSSDHCRWIFVGLNGGKVAVDTGLALKFWCLLEVLEICH